MDNQYRLNSTLFSLRPTSIIELYEIFLNDSDGVFRFHPGKNMDKNLFFEGLQYYCLPVEITGFEARSDGRLARPVLTVANVDGYITSLIKNKDDLIGRRFVRKKIFAKSLDSSNFNDGLNPFAANPFTATISEDLYIINRKIGENKYTVQFELTSPFDLENAYLPARQLSCNSCSFSYRGPGCGYGFSQLYNNQSINDPNMSIAAKKSAFTLNDSTTVFGVSTTWNLGLPLADEKDKEFFSKNGYGITGIEYKGDFDYDATYGTGDFVRVRGAVNFDFSKDALGVKSETSSFSFYICYNTPNGAMTFTDKDPRFYREYWVKDECSKRFSACKLRHAQNPQGVPYGAFPSTEDFGEPGA
jgi:lambda family phage minor tail protein L